MRRDHPLLQQLEMSCLAEEMRLVGRQQVDRDLDLSRAVTAAQQLEVVAVGRQPMVAKPAGEPAHHQRVLLVREVDAGHLANPGPELAEFFAG